jgi:hypothetical protein
MIEYVPIRPYRSCAMSLSPTAPSDLLPANADELARSMSYPLRYVGGRRQAHHGDSIMARVTAGLLVRQLLVGGYVI